MCENRTDRTAISLSAGRSGAKITQTRINTAFSLKLLGAFLSVWCLFGAYSQKQGFSLYHAGMAQSVERRTRNA